MRKYHMAAILSLLTVIGFCISIVDAYAAPKYRRSGGLVCGAVQMSHFGITNQRYRLARAWVTDFPRTTAHPGAVVFQWRSGRDSAGNPGGHVARIEQVTGSCTAVVVDEKGRYERNICGRGAVYVDPNGSAATASFAQAPPTTFHARSKKQRRQPIAAFSYPDLREAH